MSNFPQPWWQRASSASADSSLPGGCNYRTIVSTQCKVEPDEHGVPQRKCERIFRKIKECPGRPAEVVERVEESTTEQNYRDSAKNLRQLLPDASRPSKETILESDVGQIVEDFFNVAAELDRGLFQEGTEGGAHEQTDSTNANQPQENVRPDGFFGKLFKRQTPVNPKRAGGSAAAKEYGDYARDFQEV